jgi:hypothetical protein
MLFFEGFERGGLVYRGVICWVGVMMKPFGMPAGKWEVQSENGGMFTWGSGD